MTKTIVLKMAHTHITVSILLEEEHSPVGYKGENALSKWCLLPAVFCEYCHFVCALFD